MRGKQKKGFIQRHRWTVGTVPALHLFLVSLPCSFHCLRSTISSNSQMQFSSSSSSSSSSSQNQNCRNSHTISTLLFTTLITFLLLSINSSPDYNPFNTHTHKNGVEEKINKSSSKCDLSRGQWVPDPDGPQYTNSTCSTIPDSKNCFMHGRKDAAFLHWRWKPHQCDLPRFHPNNFLDFARGKALAFVGDSVARNHMDSLLCLLSTVEAPVEEYKDAKDRTRIWRFPNHQFKLMTLWTRFLVLGQQRVVNGSWSGIWDLYLDQIDPEWADAIRNADYVIISDAQWFFRPLHLHNATNTIACVNCMEPDIKHVDVSVALRLAFRAAFDHINKCEKCRVKVTLLRTFSPAHFEHGAWNTGGTCNRTGPSTEGEGDMSGDLKLREMQVEEIKRAKKEGEKSGRRFGVLDITRAMEVRHDGHPGPFWRKKLTTNDCVHWCLPGPIDIWNDFLAAVIREQEEAALGSPFSVTR